MIIQTGITDYYKAFIENANSDIEKYQEEYNTNYKVLKTAKSYVSKYILYTANQFNIRLNDDFPNTWVNEKYDKNEHLKELIDINLKDAVGEDRIILLQLLRYNETLKYCHDCLRRIELAKNRAKLKPKEYKEYLRKYYMQGVHKALLDGYAYRYPYGIGDIMINYWKYVTEVQSKIVDWAATNKRKKEILDAGLKLYNKDEAEIYKLRGIKYDGIPYVVYKTNKEYFDIELWNCIYKGNGKLRFKHANYIPYKFRNKSIEELANMFKDVDEVAVQDLGIRHKLIVAIEKDPTLYLKYIRNVDKIKQRRGSHKTKNSKRADDV